MSPKHLATFINTFFCQPMNCMQKDDKNINSNKKKKFPGVKKLKHKYYTYIKQVEIADLSVMVWRWW